MEAKKKVTNLIQFYNQNGPIKAKPPVPKRGPKDDSDRESDEEKIPEKFLGSESLEDVICYEARRVDDDSDEDSENDADSYVDDDDYCSPNVPQFSRSISLKEDETDNDGLNEHQEKSKKEYPRYEEVIYNEEKQIKNVRPARNIKDKVLSHSPLRTKYTDKIEELRAKTTVTLETFKNNSLTEASYQSFKKLLMQTRGEMKVMKPKNKKQRNKLEDAIQFTDCVLKELDEEFNKLYVTQFCSKNK